MKFVGFREAAGVKVNERLVTEVEMGGSAGWESQEGDGGIGKEEWEVWGSMGSGEWVKTEGLHEEKVKLKGKETKNGHMKKWTGQWKWG